MRYAMQRCCVTPGRLAQYETSTDALLRALGVEGVEIRGFGCCGQPLKNAGHRVQVLAAARNLALAERAGLDVLTVCDCCFGSLRQAALSLERSRELREHVNRRLAEEGLSYTGRASVRHLCQVLAETVGTEAIRARVVNPLGGMRVASHHGCHLLRPSAAVAFDDPRFPSILDRLISATGAESVPWPRRLECCGAPLRGVDDALSASLAELKIASARAAGADLISLSCPFCHLQFDRVRQLFRAEGKATDDLPALLLTQVLGLALGLDESALGIGSNESGAGAGASLPPCRGRTGR